MLVGSNGYSLGSGRVFVSDVIETPANARRHGRHRTTAVSLHTLEDAARCPFSKQASITIRLLFKPTRVFRHGRMYVRKRFHYTVKVNLGTFPKKSESSIPLQSKPPTVLNPRWAKRAVRCANGRKRHRAVALRNALRAQYFKPKVRNLLPISFSIE
jgi:hypothetical protein